MEDKEAFLIEGLSGERTLFGRLRVNGAKNAALPALASAILFEDELRFGNVPDINDVAKARELLTGIGFNIEENGREIKITPPSQPKRKELDGEIAKCLRASIIFTGPILARYGEVAFPHPGGCVIGPRPIDIFLDSYQKMGAQAVLIDSSYRLSAPNGLQGANIFLKAQSVTATETIMMAAILSNGQTIIENAAIEPEITDLAEFLLSCGAKIKGIGTHTLIIDGGELLRAKGKQYSVIPDRIEAGSFLILAALAGKELEICDCRPNHIRSLITELRDSGLDVTENETSIIVRNDHTGSSNLKPFNIKTHEYPGFPTDLQAPTAVYLTQTNGDSYIFETVFENRLNYAEDLRQMGADIKVFNQHQALIHGPTSLKARSLKSPDLRAGLAFVIAAVIAKGTSLVHNVYHIDRGYERIEERLSKLGLVIKRIENV